MSERTIPKSDISGVSAALSSILLKLEGFSRFERPLQDLLLFLFRLNWGLQFALTGWGKLNHHDRVRDFFESLSIPAPGLNAWFVGTLEFVGGGCLILGLFSRPVAFLLAGNMFVAYLSVPSDREALFGVLSHPEVFVEAAPFFFLMVSLLVLAFGPGRLSIDLLMKRSER